MRISVARSQITVTAASEPATVLDAGRDGAAPTTRPVAVLGLREGAAMQPPRTGPRRCCAHACRGEEVVCGRVELTISQDTRLGLAPRERRRVAARFVEHLQPALRNELDELVRRRGAVARRAAERMDPIEIVVDDGRLGLERIVGWVQPPQRRNGALHEIEFDLREPS